MKANTGYLVLLMCLRLSFAAPRPGDQRSTCVAGDAGCESASVGLLQTRQDSQKVAAYDMEASMPETQSSLRSRSCRAPAKRAIQNRGKGPSCKEGRRVQSGSECTPNCREDYVPSSATLRCTDGTLDPPSYQCNAPPCQAPAVLNSLASGSCDEGSSINHGGVCTPRCAEGYAVYIYGTMDETLKCYLGRFNHGSFQCVVPSPIPPPGIKRGVPIGFWRDSAMHLKLYDKSKIGWWYNWFGKVSKYSDWTTPENMALLNGDTNRNFVPMIKERSSLEQDYLDGIYEGSPYLMGFNEPYGPKINMTPREVAEKWHIVEAKARSLHESTGIAVKLVSPVVAPKSEGMNWVDEFLPLMQHHSVEFDYLNVHYYTCKPLRLKRELDDLFERFQKPIWLTEFNCGDGPVDAPAADHKVYMKATLAMLEKHPYVVRYAWMSSDAPVKGASLVDEDNTRLTDLGHYYNTFSL